MCAVAKTGHTTLGYTGLSKAKLKRLMCAIQTTAYTH